MEKLVLTLKKSILWFAGALFLVLYLYSDLIFDNYKISFASHMYTVKPWSSTETKYKGPMFTDVEDSEYPALYSVFKDGNEFSRWNNKVALGTTSSYSNLLYPLSYLYILPMDIAVFIKVCAEFLVAFIGVYLLLREYRCGKPASVIAAITYTFSASIVVWLGWGHSDVAAWAPLAFLMAEKLIEKVRLKYALLLAIIIFIMYVAGMPTFAAYFTYLLGFYVLFKTLKKYWNEKKNILWVFGFFGLAIILGVGLTLPYTISLVQSVGGNGYSESREYQAYSRLLPEYARTFIYPYFRNGLSGHINETTLYCGILSVILLPMSFFNIKKKKQVYFYGISTVVILLLIFTGVFDFIYTKMPMINTSIKYRNIVLLMFTMSVLLGINIDDIFKDRLYYKKKIYSMGILFVWGVTIISIASSKIVKLEDGDKSNTAYQQYTDYSGYYNKAVWLMLIFVALIVLYVFVGKKIVTVVICGVVIWDVCGFAKEYLPLIEKDAPIIPDKTQTIEYLQDNTGNYERIAGLGEWDMMANSNVYYGFNDVRMHDFISTNQDISTYYENIDDGCYTSATRVAFTDIDNYSLLQYLGVKYIVGDSITKTFNYSSTFDRYATTEEIPEGIYVTQEIVPTKDCIYAVQMLVGTCATEYLSEGTLKAYLMDEVTGKIVAEAEIDYKDVKNDSFIRVVFGNTKVVPKRKYAFILETPEDFEEILVLYKTAEDEDSNRLFVGNDEEKGHLIMQIEYLNESVNEIFKGNDGLVVGMFNSYSDKVFFAENVVVENEEDILEDMKDEFIQNSAFLEENHDEEVKGGSIKDNEYVSLEKYEDDYVKIKYSADEKRYIVLNDYYDKNWKAYVNGEETEVFKANYLMRSVIVGPGEDMVLEFKYEPATVDLMIVVSSVDFGLIIILAVSNYIYSKKKSGEKRESLDK